MKKALRISIPKPCHEDWNRMTPAEKGRFCNSCEKVVTDFSSMTDAQIVAFLKKPGGSTCGRFHNDQLNRAMTIPKKRMPWVKYFFQVAIPAFLVSCRNQNTTLGTPASVEIVSETNQNPPPPPSAGVTDVSEIELITREAEKAVNIYTEIVLVEHIAGGFEFVEMPERATTVVPEINEVIDTPAEKTDFVLSVPLIEPVELMGEVMIVDPVIVDTSAVLVDTVEPTKGLVEIEATSRTSIEQEPFASLKKDRSLFAFPNPVRSGGVMTIEWKGNNGKYKWQIIDIKGSLIDGGMVNLTGKNSFFEIQLPKLPAGTYVFSMSNGKGDSGSHTFIVRD